MKLLPALPTSSHASTLANTVRIEKLSDEENEEVDITDDLSDDGDYNKLQINQQGSTDGPIEEQEEAVPVKTIDQQSHATPQSPQPSSSVPSFEKTGITGIDEKANGRISPDQKHHQKGAQLDSEELPVVNEGQSFQSDRSPQTGQLEEKGTNGTGKTVALCSAPLMMMLHLFLRLS